MMYRQLLLLSPLLALVFVSPASALDYSTSVAVNSDSKSKRLAELDFDLTPDYLHAPETSWADSVMMTSLPPGSLIVRYDGPQKIIIKHARSQVRRYSRRYREYGEGKHRDIDVWNEAVSLSGWWSRSWMASLPPEKGGAPAQPYVHTIGKEITWSYGPFTLSNMLRLKIDYVAAFKFNTDPGDKTSDTDPPPVSLDVRAAKSTSFGTGFRIKVKPTIRVGMPKSDGWLSVIRSLAVRAEFDIVIFGVRFIRGDIVLKYKPDAEFSIQVGLVVGIW